MKQKRKRRVSSLHEYMEDLASKRGAGLASQVAAAPRKSAALAAANPADEPASVDPLIGRVFDERYELIALLGRDQLAATYEVRHLRLGKRFTMKVIHQALVSDARLVATFEKGAHATSRLSFPNCMSVTDFGQTDRGELYLVTEFLEGTPLTALLEQLLPLGTALEITRQILSGLHHAHQAGVLHLGLSPESVLLTRADGQWRVKIVDFAVSRLSQEAEGTAPGGAGGSSLPGAAYSAPEQQHGEQAGERADLYAVGVMLWQMITGRMPPAHVGAANEGQPRPPELEQVAPGAFAPELQTLARRALAPDLAGRFSSAKEMLDALERILKQQGRGLAPPAPGRWQWRLPAQLRSRRGALVIGGTVVLLAGVALAWSLSAITPRQLSERGGVSSGGGAVLSDVDEQASVAGDAAPPRLRQLQALLRRGACSEAQRRLRRLPESEQAHPQAQLLLGAALCCQRAFGACLQAYERAVAANSALQFSALVLQDLRRLLREPKQTEAALVFAAERMGEPGQALVLDAASNNRNARVRHQAVSVARQRGLEDRVDWVTSRGLDLAQEKSCAAQRQVIADLRELGDARAIKALEQVRSKRVWVDKVGYSGWQEKGSCVSKEAEEAIAFLRAQARPAR